MDLFVRLGPDDDITMPERPVAIKKGTNSAAQVEDFCFEDQLS
jgi:hypothetical protein